MAIRRLRYCYARWVVRLATTLLATTLIAESASAWPPKFTFQGFGTAGLVHSSEDEADFVGSLFQPNGAGHYQTWAYGVDSNLGLQLNTRFNDKLSAVVQIVSQHQYDNQYWPVLEWANLKYEFTPEFNVRVGRTVAGVFMVSDNRLVGFSFPWVRPPIELYGMAPVNNRDGVDATYQVRWGSWTHSLHAAYGLTSLKLPTGGEVDAKHFLEVNDTITRGPLTLRFGYTFGQLTLEDTEYNDLFDGFTEFGNALSAIPPFAAAGAQALSIVDEYEVDSSPVSLFALGLTYDSGPWLVMAEFARAEFSGAINDATGWYVTAGYRIGPFTPYLTFAQLLGDEQTDSGISTVGLPPPLAGAALALNAGLDETLSYSPTQNTFSVGVRWDVRKNIALKLQYDRINLGSGSQGRLANPQPEFRTGGGLDVFSFAVDFVF